MPRKATTFRIEPVVEAGLSMLSGLLDRSMNQLANEALRDYVARRTQEVEADLETTLRELRAYRAGDPKFERAIRRRGRRNTRPCGPAGDHAHGFRPGQGARPAEWLTGTKTAAGFVPIS